MLLGVDSLCQENPMESLVSTLTALQGVPGKQWEDKCHGAYIIAEVITETSTANCLQ